MKAVFIRRNAIVCLVLFSLLLLLTGCSDASADMESVDIAGIETIVVTTSSTDVTVEQGSSDQLEVVLDTNDRGPELAVTKNGDQLEVAAKGPMFRFGLIHIGRLFGNHQPTLTVKVPEGYERNLKIDGTSGDVALMGLVLEHLEVKSSSGNVDAKDMIAHEVEGMTSSGNMAITFAEFRTNMHVTSSSGDIRIRLNEENPDVSLEAETASGSTYVDFPMQGSSGGKHTSGTIGNGDYEINLRTSSGNISLSP